MATNEQISALVDNHDQDTSLLQQLSKQPESCAQWERYHMIGDVMRGDVPPQMNFDISARVAAALEDEPTVLAPNRSGFGRFMANTKVVKLVQNAGQYAIAASVAVATIFGVQQLQSSPDTTTNAPVAVLNTVPITGSVAPVSLQTGNVAQEAEQLTEEQWLERRKRIAAYLQDHRLQQRTAE